MIKISETLKKVDLLKTQQVGRVVDNKDPRQLLRLKVYIKGIYEDSDPSKLPWVFPKADASSGGKPDSSSFSVPEIGSEVTVSWTDGDVYSPMYSLGRQNNLTIPKEVFSEDYPDSEGYITRNEWFKINKFKKFVEFFSREIGHFVRFDGDGTLTIKIPKNVIVDIGGELQIGVAGSSIISSGVNHVNTSGNNTYMSAGNSFGTAGGAGGVNASCSGPVHIQSGSLLTLDSPLIHENSGMFPGAAGTPTEISALQSALAQVQAGITQLNTMAESIKTRLSEVADKIGK